MLRALLALAALLVLVATASAADRPAPPQPPPEAHLAAARDALLVAQEHLRVSGAAKSDVYGDHRKLALELVNTALDQVDTGLRLAAEAAAKREREAAQKRPAAKRRRR